MVEKNDQTIKLLHYVGLSGPGWPTFEKSYIKKVKIIFFNLQNGWSYIGEISNISVHGDNDYMI
jgi:hypothetical protein